MALNYDIINLKSTIKKPGGEQYLNLLSETYNHKEDLTGQFLIVNEYYTARPDLISLAVYGDDKYGDFICKINGISNPFELNENDVVFIPDVEYLSDYIKEPTSPNDDLITDANKDTLNTLDIGNQKKRTERRTSNQQLIGESNYTIDKSLGMVFY